jgi:hypothetical protein
VDAKRISLLAEYLDQHDLLPQDDTFDLWESLGRRDRTVARFACSYKNPKFAYEAMEALASVNLPFPPWLDGDDRVLHRIYSYLSGAPVDDATSWALAFMTPTMRSDKHVLDGLLMSRDISFKDIATTMGVRVESIIIYEKSFFNVRDRMKDAAYLRALAYPEGRIVEMVDNYLQSEENRFIMRRAGYNNGAADVLYFAGFPSYTLSQLGQSAAASARELEGAILAHGLIMARNGLVHQSSSNAYRAAGAMITASKIGGNETGTSVEDELPGVGGFLRQEMRGASGLRPTINVTPEPAVIAKGQSADPADLAAAKVGVSVFKPKKKS